MPECARRVLIVEDNYLVAAMMANALSSGGWAVVGPVPRLSEARRIAERDDFDIALLDVNLAGEMVYPVADRLNERGVPFAFLTGYGYDNSGLTTRYPQRLRLSKPFRIKDLLALVDLLFLSKDIAG